VNFPNQPPDIGALAAMYMPRPAAVRELNLNDEWRGRWYEADELPENAPVNYAYALVLMGDKGYVTRPAGQTAWGTVEGPTEPGKPESFLKTAIKAQTGATPAHTELIGFFECRATSHNPDFEKDAITVRPLYLAVAKSVGDLGPGAAYEKRRLPLNEYTRAIRDRYTEIEEQMQMACQRYAVLRARGEA
jgi:hypothetical protein